MVCQFVNLYLRERSYESARSELNFSNRTIWASFYQEVLIFWFLKINLTKLVGQGKLSRLMNLNLENKYNIGQVIDGQWVFGGVCRKSRDFFLIAVETRDSLCLTKKIGSSLRKI